MQSNTSNIDAIQYLEYWFNPIPRITIQSNTSNIDAIYLEYWCNLPGPSAADRNESNWALDSTENMAGEGELDLEVEFPKFLADVLDKTEIIFESFDSEVAEVHAEEDQTSSLLR